MSSLSRRNVIRAIEICRKHEEHWSHLRPHCPLRTYSFTSRFIISDDLSDRVLVSIEWSWHMYDVIIWHAGANYLLVSGPNVYGELNPEHFMETRRIGRREGVTGACWVCARGRAMQIPRHWCCAWPTGHNATPLDRGRIPLPRGNRR